jgi:hypothetical protein
MKKKIQKNNTDYSLAHVLYQKLGSDWYAFTEKDGDCFMTKVDPETVEIPEYALEAQESRAPKRRAA